MNTIDAERVEKLFKKCLCDEGGEFIALIDGIAHKCYLDLRKLRLHEDEIVGMLKKLPDQFRKKGGGGWSFLNLCNDRDGEQWTGFHLRMEQLVMMAMALRKAEWTLPREMWKILPGEMPYVTLYLDEDEGEME